MMSHWQSAIRVAVTDATTIRLLRSEEYAVWDRFVEGHPVGGLYHRSLWIPLMQSTYRYEPYYLGLFRGGELMGGLPLFLVKSRFTGWRLVSLPQADWCCPLACSDEDFDLLIRSATELVPRVGADYLEIRTLQRCAGCRFLHTAFTGGKSFANHVVPLDPDPNVVWERLHKGVRRNIKRAVRDGLRYTSSVDLADVDRFYRLFVLTRRQHGLPPQPFRFFEHLAQLLAEAGILFLDRVQDGGRDAAAMLGAVYKRTAYALYEASDPSLLPGRPNHLLIWEEVHRSCRAGLSAYDLGRTAFTNDGLLHFKRSWGAQERTMIHYRFPPVQESVLNLMKEDKGRRLRTINRHLPAWALRCMGAAIYPHVG